MDSVFSRLFEVQSPAQAVEVGKQLVLDKEWRESIWDLGSSFGPADADGYLRVGWKVYSTPMGSSKKVPAGVIARATGNGTVFQTVCPPVRCGLLWKTVGDGCGSAQVDSRTAAGWFSLGLTLASIF